MIEKHISQTPPLIIQIQHYITPLKSTAMIIALFRVCLVNIFNKDLQEFPLTHWFLSKNICLCMKKCPQISNQKKGIIFFCKKIKFSSWSKWPSGWKTVPFKQFAYNFMVNKRRSSTKLHNRLMILCEVWIRLAYVTPKGHKDFYAHWDVRLRRMAILPKLCVYPNYALQ